MLIKKGSQTETIYTFWQLINEHRIEVPIIQRDYAQGRDNKKAEQIRVEFVGSLIRSLLKKENLHIDFIYGKIKGTLDRAILEKNHSSINQLLHAVKGYAKNLSVDIHYNVETTATPGTEVIATYFVPLDGQQRLTTLFLLHWYLSFRRGKIESTLHNFTYKTRKSSTAFCNALVDNTTNIEVNGLKLSECITDAVWFSTTWIKDPTVSGMLRVLDEIHSRMQSQDINTCWNNLIEGRCIYFDFLNLDKLKLEDDLYVKMNARGKELTEFENFKAWLSEYSEENNFDPAHFNWSNKIDKEWTDLFWRAREMHGDIDVARMNFIKIIMFYQYAEGVILENDKLKDKDKKVATQLLSEDFTPRSFYGENNLLSENELTNTFALLTYLEERNTVALADELKEFLRKPFVDISISKAYFKEFQKLNIFHKSIFYSIYLFLIKKGKQVTEYSEADKSQLKNWVRFTRNLIYNARLDDQSELVKAIVAIKKLSKHAFTIEEDLARDGVEISYFPIIQREEEILKAKLFCQDSNWKPLITKYENHEYFYGQVDFLLKMSMHENQYKPELFSKYAEQASIYFSPDVLDRGDFLLERALFAKGDYLIEKGSDRYSFCLSARTNARLRDENWRSVFNNDEKRLILRKLLDDGRDLAEIIRSEGATVSDYRKHFILFPGCIRECNQRLIWRFRAM